MRIARIELENWMPFGGRFELDLPAGPIAVTATYTGNPRRSNWAGKTALLEAIRWALFGKHRKRVDDDVIHRGTERTRVRLVFTDGLVVTRTKSTGKAVRLTVEHDGHKTTKKAAQEKIEEVLGMTDDDLTNTLHFAQGDIEAIVERRSSKRREVVAAWLDLEAWSRVASRIRVAGKTLRDELERARGKLETLNAAAFEITEVVHWCIDEAAEGLEERVGRHAGELFALRERAAELEDILEEVAEAEIGRQDAIRAERVATELADIKKEIRASNLSDAKKKLEAARARLSVVERDEANARDEVAAARGLVKGDFDGVCPVTCEGCPVADDIRENTTAARTRLKSARTVLDGAAAASKTERANVRAAEANVRRIDRLVADFNAKASELKRLEATVANAREIRYSDDELEEMREERKRILGDAVTVSGRLAGARQDAARFGATITAREEALDRVATLEAELRIRQLAARCVGPSGVPARIAERELAALEERANVILSDVGLSFRFTWDRELQDLTPTCYECGYRFKGQADKSCPACGAERPLKRSDELGILVSDGGPEEDVRAKSGGAKVLVGSAIRLAAGAMLRDIRDTRAAWATIDEPFGPLDAENRHALAAAFAGLLGSVGLEQAFVVSHDAALLDALPGRIEIVRDGSSSSIRVR